MDKKDKKFDDEKIVFALALIKGATDMLRQDIDRAMHNKLIAIDTLVQDMAYRMDLEEQLAAAFEAPQK